MVAETISLGVLSLPAAVAGLGLVPAVIICVGLGLMASYTGYVIGQFKWRFPHISGMPDAGEILMGAFGREVLFAGQMLFLVFLMASHLLTFTVALNQLTEHATCSIVFGVVGLVVSLCISLPRTLEKMSWLSLVCMFSYSLYALADSVSFHQHYHCRFHCDDCYRHSKSLANRHSYDYNEPGYRIHVRVEHHSILWYDQPIKKDEPNIRSEPQYLLQHDRRIERPERLPQGTRAAPIH